MRSQYISLMYIIFLFAACKKQDFLSAKPTSTIVVPSTLKDFQALLDIYRMNETASLGEQSTDTYIVNGTDALQYFDTRDRNTYLWAPDIYEGQGNVPDWNIPYHNILSINVVLEGMQNGSLNGSSQTDWNNVKGQALFLRAYQFYNLLQIFAPVYNPATADKDLGIPLRLATTIAASTPRATVSASYNQVLADLYAAMGLLPAQVPAIYRNRASRPACYAMLARVYLAENNFALAAQYADSCLQLMNVLMDYNRLVVTDDFPFDKRNIEVLFQSQLYTEELVLSGLRFMDPSVMVDTSLYASYDSNDLRKDYFFIPMTNGQYTRSGYSADVGAFTGLAVDEVYLIAAESAIRNGKLAAGLQYVNTLLGNRYKAGTYSPLTGISTADALARVLQERRKELLLRGVRWTDLKRLNLLGANIELRRVLGNKNYTLAPNSPLYTLPIPPDAIALGGYQQNPR